MTDLKIAGVVAEYNPFHNGHKHQIDEIKKDCDAVIAVMSGSFVQRGDIAITDKWTRAKAAVMGGCDLVLELPVCYSLSSANVFAQGSVEILNKLNVADNIYFGSENGNIDDLKSAADIMSNETKETSDKIKEYISFGISYPAAVSKAYSDKIQPDLLYLPNNILGIEYIRALKKFNSPIIPKTIIRNSVSHDEESPAGEFASASYIRELIQNNIDYSDFVPKSAYEVYKNSDMTYNIKNLDELILGYLRLADPKNLENIIDMAEGLENRILSSAFNSATFEELCASVKSKRYTLSRIRRIVLASVLNLKELTPITYVRVLSMNDTGKAILKEVKKESKLDIIIKPSLYKKNNKLIYNDFNATDIHSLASKIPNSKIGKKDYLTSPVII